MTAPNCRVFLFQLLATPLATVVCALFAAVSLAKVPATADVQASGDEIESLIEKLASPNEAPVKLVPIARYPKGYDRDAQKRVNAAWRELRAVGVRAFPHLINHFNDERYSFTHDNGFVYVNCSVGKACADIIKCHLQPFGFFPYAMGLKADDGGRPHGALRPGYAGHHKLDDPVEAAKWWATHEHKTLLELQIEAIEWTIAEEAKRPERYTDKERAYLNEYLERARKADGPLGASLPFPK